MKTLIKKTGCFTIYFPVKDSITVHELCVILNGDPFHVLFSEKLAEELIMPVMSQDEFEASVCDGDQTYILRQDGEIPCDPVAIAADIINAAGFGGVGEKGRMRLASAIESVLRETVEKYTAVAVKLHNDMKEWAGIAARTRAETEKSCKEQKISTAKECEELVREAKNAVKECMDEARTAASDIERSARERAAGLEQNALRTYPVVKQVYEILSEHFKK